MKKVSLLLAFAMVCLSFLSLPAQGILYTGDAAADDEFGATVSVYGNFAAISADRSDALGPQSGAVYIYQYDGSNWNETQKITAPDGEAWDYFGDAVEIHENYLIIGSYFDDNQGKSNNGAAYIYHKNGTQWELETKVFASDAKSSDWLGGMVDINDDFALLGARGRNGRDADDKFVLEVGAAYVFRNLGNGEWEEVQILTPTDPVGGEEFGAGTAMDGDHIFVGAPRIDHSAGHRGSVYVFEKTDADTFALVVELEHDTGGFSDQFGLRVDASDGRLLASSQIRGVVIEQDENGVWQEEATLVPPSSSGWGSWVDVRIEGDYALVNNSIGGFQAPLEVHLYHFENEEWVFQESLVPSTGENSQRFSHSYDLHEGKIIVGAPRHDMQGDNAGVAFAYDYGDFSTASQLLAKESLSLQLYPNPAVDFLQVSSDDWAIERMVIYNALGERVWSGSYEDNVEVGHLPAGYYTLWAIGENGRAVVKGFLK